MAHKTQSTTEKMLGKIGIEYSDGTVINNVTTVPWIGSPSTTEWFTANPVPGSVSFTAAELTNT